MKKGLSLILMAALLTVMLMVGGLSALAAGEAKPEDAKSVLDISYLPKDQALNASTGAAVYQDQAFDDSKLKLSCVTVDGEDWLKYEYGDWFNGLLVDLNTAKGQTPAKGVTDWTGATMVWFYVDAEDGAILDLELRAVKGEDTGFFTSKNADVKYYYQDEYGLVPVTLANDNNDWGHIALAEGYEGWVGVELANFGCGSGHLADQNLSSYLGQVTGVGFYAEKSCLVRDFRVTGVAKGLDDAGEPVVPADVSPDDAKPVVDFSYLPEDRVLTLEDGIDGLDSSAVTSNDLVVSMSKANGKAWLNYERNNTNWNAGIYVDLLNAASKGKAVTDWTGATTLWFYARTEAITYIDIVAAVDNEYSGEVQGYFRSEASGLTYYVEEDGAFVEKTTSEDTWKHILLPADYEGWVGFDLSQMICRSGHLKEQDFAAHLGDIYGIGFYMEGGPIAATDFRVDGIVRGLEEGQGGTSSTGSDISGSGSTGSNTSGTGSTGSNGGSGAPQTGVPFALLPAALVLAAGAGLVLLRKSKADAR